MTKKELGQLKTLVCNFSEPESFNGSAAIVVDLVDAFEAGKAEIYCEQGRPDQPRREIELDHRITKFHFQWQVWPFRKGWAVREVLANVGLPVLVGVGWWRTRQLEPDAIIAVYNRTRWILGAHLISRLSGVPLLYYVHDEYLEKFRNRGRLIRGLAARFERRTLASHRALVLHAPLARRYAEMYDLKATLVRRMVSQTPLSRQRPQRPEAPATIAFAGAIYENNVGLLRELSELVDGDPRLRLVIWSRASAEELAEHGIVGDGVTNGSESRYDRLLQHLAEADLVYLPLAFGSSEDLTTQALRYAFPTKTIDYLLAGAPILCHCPAEYGVSVFVEEHQCGHRLTRDGKEVLRAWLDRWLDGEVRPFDDDARLRALHLFSREENVGALMSAISEARRKPREFGLGKGP